MSEEKYEGKSVKIMPEIHRLLYLKWKDTKMGISAQITELVRNSRKYKKYKEADNA